MSLPPVLQNRLSVPVVGSPMFIVSNPTLVTAQCKAGIVGSFPALNARPQSALKEWIVQIKEDLAAHDEAHPSRPAAPFAVNQICHATNERLFGDMETCVEQEVPIIITSLRPPAELVEAAHSYGGVVFHDVINDRHARKAAEQGVDGLILVAAGAGGHAGTTSPFALVREVKSWFDGTILLSGCISDGFSVAGAIAMGADLAYVGTRFIASAEANANERYKQMIIEASSKDIAYTNLFSGVHGSYLKESIRACGFDPDNLPDGDKSTMDFGSGGNTDVKAWVDILSAGQGVGGITDAPPVAEIVARMTAEYDEACGRLASPATLEAA